jgi:Na+/H+ antiporter NhaD/arsenite permease-like protein
MSTPLTIAVVVVFTLTYVLIAARRVKLLPIGRPAGALVGAVLMVAIGALTPAESYRAIDGDTIVLLFGIMLLTVYLEQAGLFVRLASRTLAVCRRPMTLLIVVSLLSAGLSAFLVNDTVCLFLTPVVVALCVRSGLPFGPFLIAVATSSNLGSAATIVGNPQNMIIGSLSRIPFTEFLLRAAPATLAALAANLGLLWLYYRRQLGATLAPAAPEPPHAVQGPPLWLVAAVLGGVVAGFFAGLHLGFTVLSGVTVLVLVDRRDLREVFGRVDWALLVFFCSLFIVVHALTRTGLVEAAWRGAAPHLGLTDASGIAWFTVVITAGSNLVSNVPMTLLAGPHLSTLGSETFGWVLLAYVATVAGNLTLVGSVANIIVAERARDHYALGYLEYLRFGVVSTVVSLLVGVPILWLTFFSLG